MSEKETISEVKKLELLASGLLVQMIAKFKEQYKGYTDQQLIDLYHEQQGIIREAIKEFETKISIILDAIKELMKERGMKFD